jgi:hypothetical protein
VRYATWRAWRRFLARFRLDLDVVCAESAGHEWPDYHDYPDSTTPEPWHFFQHECSRCGKKFWI